MASSPPSNLYSPGGLTRWYLDTRPLTASTSSLPLLSTLQPADQTTVQKFYHLADRHMSLASYLLKYLFIHQTCRVPWDQVTISRTAAPHSRPCYIPVWRNEQSHINDVDKSNNQDTTPKICNIEFNVSHQASMVALAGCIIPPDCSTTRSTSDSPSPSPAIGPSSAPQIGIDIACTSERETRNNDSVPKTEAELHSFIDIFSEVFSPRELQDMKAPPTPSLISTSGLPPGQQAEGTGDPGKSYPDQRTRSINHRLRRFYTYWALKEAYIKMTGEALLAPWLRELEFRDVVAPEPQHAVDMSSTDAFGTPSTGTKILLHGKQIDEVRMEVVALGQAYLFATAARGKGVGRDSIPAADESSVDSADIWTPFRAIDIENDIAPCATGECACLSP